MMKVTFLGTSATTSTKERNMISTMIVVDGKKLLFDCGEGTGRQIKLAGAGMDVDAVFLTHFHADHTLGLPNLILDFDVSGRKAPLNIYAPEGIYEYLDALKRAGYNKPEKYKVFGHKVEPKGAVDFGSFKVIPFPTKHRCLSYGYAIFENPRRGKFNVERARELGVTDERLYAALCSGKDVAFTTMESGGRSTLQVVKPEQVIGPEQPGKRLVYSGDTYLDGDEETVRYIDDADMWISEATFLDADVELAKTRLHTTAGGAARLAREMGVKHLALNHLSPRYKDGMVLNEAASVFEGELTVPADLQVVEV